MSTLYVGSLPVELNTQVAPSVVNAVEDSYILLYESQINNHTKVTSIEDRLNHNGIKFGGELIKYSGYDGNEYQRSEIDKYILDCLYSGKNVFITSDDGLAGITDPGARLLNLVSQTKHDIRIVSETSVVTAAYLLSGKVGHNNGMFFYGGMLNYVNTNMLVDMVKNNGNLVTIFLVNDFESDNIKNIVKRIYTRPHHVVLCCDIGFPTQKIVKTNTDQMFDVASTIDYKYVTLVITDY